MGAPDAGWGQPSALSDDLPSLFTPSTYENFAAGEHGNDLYDLIQAGGEVVDVWKVQDGTTIPAGCLERYVNETHNLWWACLNADRAYQYINVPIFVIHTQYDFNTIFNQGGAPEDIVDPLQVETTKEYIDMYGKAFVLSFEKFLNIDTSTTKAHPDGIFAASCLTHGTARDVTIDGGYNKIDIVGDWFFQLGELTEYHRQVEQCADTGDLRLPCNPAKGCQFKFPSPLVEACTREITSAGCLNSANENQCNMCLLQNQDVIIEGGCYSKDQKNLKRVAQEICGLQYAAPTGSPTASPTGARTTSPTSTQTSSPTNSPTASPTGSPTASPTGAPTGSPSAAPTGNVAPLAKVHINKAVTRSSVKGKKWKPKLTFKIVDSETNKKVKDVKFTILMSYGKRMRQKTCTSKPKGNCKFNLNKVSSNTASVKIGFVRASGDGVVYDGSNNKNRKGCKLFSDDCPTFDILAPVK